MEEILEVLPSEVVLTKVTYQDLVTRIDQGSKVIMLIDDKSKVGPGSYDINDSFMKGSPRVSI